MDVPLPLLVGRLFGLFRSNVEAWTAKGRVQVKNTQTFSFVMGALMFGYYAGYAYRSITPEPTAAEDDFVTILAPAASIFMIIYGLLWGAYN
jgi:hypothetical protein